MKRQNTKCLECGKSVKPGEYFCIPHKYKQSCSAKWKESIQRGRNEK